MAYLGNSPVLSQQEYRNIDNISSSFNGSTTSFALLVNGVAPVPAPQSSNQCLISVNGVVQKPDDTGATGFRISGGNIIFSSAPTGGQSFFGVILAGSDYIYAGQNFPDGTVSAPSITFAQDTDTGFFRSGAGEIKYTANGTAVVTLSSNNLTAPSFIPTSSSAPTNGVYLPAANTVGISTGGSGRLFIDSSGRVGIGTTSPGALLDLVSSSDASIILTRTAAANAKITTTSNGALAFSLDTSGGNTERARIDSSGRLLVGTSTARGDFFNTSNRGPSLQVEGTTTNTSGISVTSNQNNDNGPEFNFGKSRGTNTGSSTIVSSGDGLGRISFQGTDGSELVPAAYIEATVDGTPGTNDMPGRLVFSTTPDGSASPVERMRITNDGLVRVGDATGGAGIFQAKSSSTAVIGSFYATNASFSSDVLILSADRNTTTSAYNFLQCVRQGAAVTLCIRDSGNVQNVNNSYTAFSDIKLKENIVDANSQWADIKALRVRNYNFKEETGQSTHRQIGLVAQELETVCPHLVDESPDRDFEGNDLGTVTKGVNYSVLYMKAVKALQEAMERIEQLEAKVAALESA